jgi:CRISPR-associated exonuclease Cas4
MTATVAIVAGAGLAVLLGLVLILGGRGMRQRQGLGEGRTVALDNVTLTSRRLGLTGRPDRLVKFNGKAIPEEWSSWT